MTEKKVEVKKEVAPKEKYYRSLLNGLTLVLNANVTDPTMIEKVRFVTVTERYQGDIRKVGYLATSDPRVIKIAESDINVQEVSKREYKEAFGAPVEDEIFAEEE